jgi:Tol biopolymer transport system component
MSSDTDRASRRHAERACETAQPERSDQRHRRRGPRLLGLAAALALSIATATTAAAGTTTRVSVDSGGTQGNDESFASAISGDGRYVAFSSAATNLVSGDTNGTFDIFVHDRQTGATTRVSVDSSGAQGNDHSGRVAISGDGRYVAFSSEATNLDGTDANGTLGDIYVHDRQTGATTRVSVDSGGAQGNAA